MNDELNKKILREIQKSIAELKEQGKSASQSTQRKEVRKSDNIIITVYHSIGKLPFLGPIVQCFILINICCAFILAFPPQFRNDFIFPVLRRVWLMTCTLFYPLLHTFEQVAPPEHTFYPWFEDYLPATLLAAFKAMFS